MNRTLKKGIKITIITFISLLLLVFIATGILVSFVVTPEKLTPIINNVANDYLKSELQFGSVDISLFGYFPHVGVTLKDGKLMSAESIKTNKSDTTAYNRDTLASFSKIDVWVNPWVFLYNNKIDIDKIEVIEPKIYAYVSATGEQSWDILNIAQTIDTTEVDTTNVTALDLSQVNLRGFIIQDANLIFDNRAISMYTGVESFNFSLKGDIGNKSARLKLSSSLKNVLIWKDGEVLAEKFNLGLESFVTGDSNKKQLILEKGKLSLNNIELNAEGSVSLDSVNINASIESKNIQKIIDMIPNSINVSKNRYKSSGEVIVDANIVGTLKNGKLPIVDGVIVMNKISIHHDEVKYGIDDISAKMEYYIDINEKYKSNISIKYFKAKASKSEVDISTQITNIFTNPTLDLSGKMNINLDEISELTPFKDSVRIGGNILFEGSVLLDTELIKRGDYAKIPANAKLSIDSVEVLMPYNDIDISINNISAHLSNSKDKYLQVEAEIKNSKLKFKAEIDAFVGNANATMSGIRATDSTSILKGTFGSSGIDVSIMQDSLRVKTASLDMDILLSKEEKKLHLTTDSILTKYLNNSTLLSKANFDLFIKNRELSGEVEFSDLTAHIDGVSIPIKMKKTALFIEKSNVKLSDATFIVGESDITLTGNVNNILEAIKGEGVMTINSLLKSKYININELTTIYTPNTEEPTTEDLVADTTLSVFAIPKNMVVNFDMDIDSLKFGDLPMSDLRGNLKMDSTSLVLSAIGINTLNARLTSALEYKTPSQNSADSRFVVSAEKIDIKDVIRLLPSIDSILPMIKSLSGVVSLNMTADAKFDSLMNIDRNTLSGAINISGKNIELLDSKVLDKVADMLFFKKKSSNNIDALSIDLIIDSGRVMIIPFKLDINRYSLAIGGDLYTDNSFKYHISVLKSPVPFKMGINITGNINDIDNVDIGFGKAKYKRENAPIDIGKVNPIYIEKWNKISHGLKWK